MFAGRKAYGDNLSFPSRWVIDIPRKLDFDFFIDGEHGPFGLDQLEDLRRTAQRHNMTTIARVPDIGSSNHPALSRSWEYEDIGSTHRHGGGRPTTRPSVL